MEEVDGTARGAVKCSDPGGTTYGESSQLGHIRRSDTKARGAKRIRYPCSPGRKRCPLGVAGFGSRCRREGFKAGRLGITVARLKLKVIDGALPECVRLAA